MPDLQDGLGTLEIRVDPIRYVVCADSTQDAAFDMESWILRKAQLGFRNTINNAIICGHNPSSGILICDTAPSTKVSTLGRILSPSNAKSRCSGAGASYFMNQRTLDLLLTMSDATQRPLWGQLPGGLPGYIFAGSPIQVVRQMPDMAPGSTPTAFGNWAETYVVVTRSGMTMRPDPYSAGFCVFPFRSRGRRRDHMSERVKVVAHSMSSTRFLPRVPCKNHKILKSCAVPIRRAGAEVMTDPDYADVRRAAREAPRWLGDEDAPRALEEAIANLQGITSRILEAQRSLEDAQHRLEQQLAAVADEIEERWQALGQQLAAVTSRYRYD
jgi:hypothetical protein